MKNLNSGQKLRRVFLLGLLCWLVAAFLIAVAYFGIAKAQAIAEDKCIPDAPYSIAEWAIIWPIELALVANSPIRC